MLDEVSSLVSEQGKCLKPDFDLAGPKLLTSTVLISTESV
jgi:hypothetical protein